MSLLKDLYRLSEGNGDLTRLPADVAKAIKSNIRKGAEDLQQNWANALELCHKAYEVEGASRPTPDMKDAWTQYEEHISYSVEQLAKNRGMDGDWRMSSSIFHEALHQKAFKVILGGEEFITEGRNLNTIIDVLSNKSDCDVTILENGHTKEMHFSKWGIKNPIKVVIEELN